MLDYDVTLELIKKAQSGDEEAKNQLVSENIPLIKSVIKRFKFKGIEYDDLFQLGSVGFIKAIRNFDTSFNVKFSTYAVPMIAGEVKRFLRDDGVIKVSRSIKQKSLLIRKYVQEQKQLGKSPTIEQIAKEFEIDSHEVVFVMESGYLPYSINEKYSDDESSNSIEEKFSDDFSVEKIQDKIMIRDLISSLTAREKSIIIMRYYLDKTQSEIAKQLGVSQVQISRLENKILEKLKNKIN